MIRPSALVESYIKGLENRSEIVPGAGEFLARAAAGHGDAGAALNAVVEFLEANPRFKNPEAPERPAEAPARQHLRRLESGGLLARGRADRLYESLAGRLATVPDEVATKLLAEHVADRLDEGDLRAAHRPPLDHRAQKVRNVFGTIEGHLRAGLDLDRIAQKWGEEFGHLAPAAVARMVLGRLNTPAHAEDLTRDGQPLELVGPITEFTGQAPAGSADMEAQMRQHIQY